MTTRLSQATPFGAQPNTATPNQPSSYFDSTVSDPFSFVQTSPVKSGLGPSSYADQGSNVNQPNIQIGGNPPGNHPLPIQIGGNPPLPVPASYSSGQPLQAPSLPIARGGLPVISPTSSTTHTHTLPLLPTVDTRSRAADDPHRTTRSFDGPSPPLPYQKGIERPPPHPPPLSHHGRSTSVPAASALFPGHQGDDDIFSTVLSSKSNVFPLTSNPQTHPLRDDGMNSVSARGGPLSEVTASECPPPDVAGLRRASYTGPAPGGPKNGPLSQDWPPSKTPADTDDQAAGSFASSPPTGEGGPHYTHAAKYGMTAGESEAPEVLGEGAFGGGRSLATHGDTSSLFDTLLPGLHGTDVGAGGGYGGTSLTQGDRGVYSGGGSLEDSYEREEPKLTLAALAVEEDQGGSGDDQGGNGDGQGGSGEDQGGNGDGHGGSDVGQGGSGEGQGVSLLNNDEDFANLSPIKLLPPTTGALSTYDNGSVHGTSVFPTEGQYTLPTEGQYTLPAAGGAAASELVQGGDNLLSTTWTSSSSAGLMRGDGEGVNRLFTMGSVNTSKESGLHSQGAPPMWEPTRTLWGDQQPSRPGITEPQQFQLLQSEPLQSHVQPLWSQSQTQPSLQSHTQSQVPQTQTLSHTLELQSQLPHTQPLLSRGGLGTQHKAHAPPSTSSDPLLPPISSQFTPNPAGGGPLLFSTSQAVALASIPSAGLPSSLLGPKGIVGTGHVNSHANSLPPSSTPHSSTASLYHQATNDHSIPDLGPPRGYQMGSEPPRDSSEPPRGYPTGPEQPRGYPTGPEQPRSYSTGPEQPRISSTGPEPPRGYSTGPEPPRGYPTGPEQPRGYPTGPEPPRVYPTGPEPPRGYPTGPEPPRGHPTGPEQQRGYPTGPEQPRGYPTGPEPPRGYPAGPEPPRGYPTGPEQPKGYPTIPEPPRGYPTGPEPPRGYPTGPEPPRGYPTGPEPPRGYPTGPEPPRGYPTGPEQPRVSSTGPEQPRGYPEQPSREEHDPRMNSRYMPPSASGEHHYPQYGDRYNPYHYPAYRDEGDYYRPRGDRHPPEDRGYGPPNRPPPEDRGYGPPNRPPPEDWGYGPPNRYYPGSSDWYYYDYDPSYEDPYFRPHGGYDPYDPYGAYYGAPYDYDYRYGDPRSMATYDGRRYEGSGVGGENPAQSSHPGVKSDGLAHEASSIYTYGSQGNFEESKMDAPVPQMQPQTSSHFDMSDYAAGDESGNQNYYGNVECEETGERQLEAASRELSSERQPSATPPPPRRETPEIFYNPHVMARFGIGGHLVVVLPDVPYTGQRGLVEILSLPDLLGKEDSSVEMDESVDPFLPGETPKSSVVHFAQVEAGRCREAARAAGEDEGAKRLAEDEALLWDFLVLLCQQNGILVPSDVGDLLLRDEGVHPTKLYGQGKHVGTNLEDCLDEFRRRLLAGRRRDALELACTRCLWGHALMLSSGMDEQSRTYVVNRFTASLVTADPLSTFYTLLLGRTPSSVKPEGLQRAGDWRPHLAMILTNQNSKDECGAILSLGDALLAQGRVCAAHLCYLLAHVQLGTYGDGGARYSLLGTGQMLLEGACPSSSLSRLRMTEVYEYAMSLGKRDFALPGFQTHKYLHMLQLVEQGLVGRALMYCESIARAAVKCAQECRPAMLLGLVEFSTRLYYATSPAGLVEEDLPAWIVQLQRVIESLGSPDNSTSSSTSQLQHGPVPILGRESLPEHNPQPILGLGQYLTSSEHQREGSTRASSRAEHNPQTVASLGTLPGHTMEDLASQPAVVQQREETQRSSAEPGTKEAEIGGLPHISHAPSAGVSQGLFPLPSQGLFPLPSQGQFPLPSQGQFPLPSQGPFPLPSQGPFPLPSQGPLSFPAQYGNDQGTEGNSQPHTQMLFNPEQSQSGGSIDLSSSLTGAGSSLDNTAGFQPFYGQYPMSYQPPGEHTNMFEPPVAQPTPGALSYGQDQGQLSSNMAGQPREEMAGGRRAMDGQDDTLKQGNGSHQLEAKSHDRRSAEKPQVVPTTKPAPQPKEAEKKVDSKPAPQEKRDSIVGSLFKYLIPTGKKKEAHLPSDKDKRIVWDKEKNKWVNLDEGEQEQAPVPPPPTDGQLRGTTIPPAGGPTQPTTTIPPAGGPTQPTTSVPPARGPTQPTTSAPAGPRPTTDAPVGAPSSRSSIYSMRSVDTRRLGVRSKYVDVLNPGGGAGTSMGVAPAPAPLPMGGSVQPFSGKLFVPQPGGGGGSMFEEAYGTGVPEGGSSEGDSQGPLASAGSAAPVGDTHAPPTAVGAQSFPEPSSQAPAQFSRRPQDQTAAYADTSNYQTTVQQQLQQPRSGSGMTSGPNEVQQAPQVQFFNPNAFGPMPSGMVFSAGSEVTEDNASVSSTVSEPSQEVRRYTTSKPQEVPTAQVAGYNKLKMGLRARQQVPPQGQVRPLPPGSRPPNPLGFPQQ